MTLKPLTPKEKSFVEAYMTNGFNASKAYRLAYETDNSDVSKAEGWKMLAKPKIKIAIEALEGDFAHLARKMRLGRSDIMKGLQDLVYGKNDRIKLEAIKVTAKICGNFPEQQEVVVMQEESEFDGIDISKLTPDEQEAMRQRLLNSMM